MYHDMPKLMFISMSNHWTNDERKRYIMFTPQHAHNYLKKVNRVDFGYSQWKWALYYLLVKLNPVGIIVLFGFHNGKNRAYLEHILDASNVTHIED